MGRLIKRVQANFSYPLNKIWVGYINPYGGHKCPVCDGDGLSKKGKKYSNDWYGWDTVEARTPNGGYWHPNAHEYNLEQYEVDALWKENRLQRYFQEKPTAEEVNKWASSHTSFCGHDSLNEWICAEAHAKKHNYDISCPYCHGNGYIRDEELFQNWKREDPPTGDWYQLWEDTSEGSPMTPAFETPEELAKYCADNEVSIFGKDTIDYEQWLDFIKSDGPAVQKIADGFVSIIR